MGPRLFGQEGLGLRDFMQLEWRHLIQPRGPVQFWSFRSFYSEQKHNWGHPECCNSARPELGPLDQPNWCFRRSCNYGTETAGMTRLPTKRKERKPPKTSATTRGLNQQQFLPKRGRAFPFLDISPVSRTGLPFSSRGKRSGPPRSAATAGYASDN